MAPIPKPQASIVSAIYAAYEAANEQRDGKTIPAGQLADECSRKLFYEYRWTTPHEAIDGRTLRIFETGNVEESRWIDNLRMIGCDVVDRQENGRQIRVELCGGHVGGYLDSEILGLPEAPKTWHVGEIKSHNLKSFTALKKDGVKVSKPLHYGQMQVYMHARGRGRAIYLAVCKDNDELYAERIHYDPEYSLRLMAKAERIIHANEPPAKLHEDPRAKTAFACGWCKHRGICHEDAWPRTNCRTCLYSSPESGGSWSCARFSKPLSLAEQAEGCPAHLYLPSLVPGTQIDSSEEDETVTYELRPDGRIWVDGAANDNTPTLGATNA
ncbi:oxidoreductase [Agrobacterium tumefaciens]|uniref:oxidoreductase n=1 Tax=Agrobacterium tumefaciens TaxID=358 RepID=UPI001574A246|nr:oxidoreductase [Agrobacterium tumefaciens]NTA16040.1 oxidoreductase [Agrobacterium tumefaciens]WCK69612.1 oxidoreductase [Agrobacterium tumefaciens]